MTVSIVIAAQQFLFQRALPLPQAVGELRYLRFAHAGTEIQSQRQHGPLGALQRGYDFVDPALHRCGGDRGGEFVLDAIEQFGIAQQFFFAVPLQQGFQPALQVAPLVPAQVHVAVDVPGDQPVEVIVGKGRRAAGQQRRGQHQGRKTSPGQDQR